MGSLTYNSLIYRLCWVLAAGALPVGNAACAAEDPGARAVQQNQLQRQQQQDALQLRMQQHQRATQGPPRDPKQKQELETLQAGQRQRQQELHYRHSIEPTAAHPADDAGTRRAKEEMERRKAQRRGQEQLRRLDAEQRGK